MKSRSFLLGTLPVAVSVMTAFAGPLRLDYEVTSLGGGVFNYDFSFVNDNNDGSWSAGQSFRWFVIGDVPTGSTPLTGFVGNTSSFVNSPYTGFGTTSGGHNGPSLAGVFSNWIPSGIGDSFQFSGTSTADLAQGQLRWSNVITGSGNPGVMATFEIANRIENPVIPLPTGAALAVVGISVIGVRRRR